ncbi:uncharacterized protein LOC123292074 [Chrysoperla carnea]|uniref:uncharacterized protein LOC123292074 n=1 Tax=Chrysoperla carnea TaxID=189513 RepID=UPI001D07F33E|nr:uncharacterized protein LOC123292074 [Chrysoperla carnea]
MEDLMSTGYGLSKLITLDYDHCTIALKTIARMHAYGFTNKYNTKFSEMTEKISENKSLASWFNESVDILTTALETMPNSKDINNTFKKYCESLYKSFTSEKYPKSLCHNQLLRKNLMFRYNKYNKPLCCRFINFQSISLSLPTIDIFTFLYSNTTSEFREKHLFELTNYYYNELYIIEELSDEYYKQMLLEIFHEIQEISIQRNISKELCMKLINDSCEGYKINIKSFACTPISGKSGFLGSHSILHINANIDDELTKIHFFVKFLPTEPGQMFFLNIIQGFIREALIYKEIFQIMTSLKINVNTIIANCYMVCSNALVFDLLEEYRVLPKIKMFDYKHVEIMFKSLAKLHAASVILEEKLTERDGECFILGEKYRNIFFEFMYQNGKIVTAMPMGIILVNDLLLNLMDRKCLKKKLDTLLEKLPYYTTASSKYRNFGRYLPQSHDVMCALHQTTTIETRQKHKLQLQTQYYKYFKKELQEHDINCEDVITFEEFLESCEEMEPFALLQTARNFQFWMMSPEYEKEYFSNPELQNRFNDGDVFDLISRNLHTKAYREIMQDTHGPLLEYLKRV